MVGVEGFGPKLHKSARDEVLMREKQMAKGQPVPFSAGKQAVRDNAGAVRTSLSDADRRADSGDELAGRRCDWRLATLIAALQCF